MDIVVHFTKAIERILDIAQFSLEEKKSLTRELVLSLLTKTFYAETSTLSKEEDRQLAQAIRSSKDIHEMMRVFSQAFTPSQYQVILSAKAQEMLEKFVATVSDVAPDEQKTEFNKILEEFVGTIKSAN